MTPEEAATQLDSIPAELAMAYADDATEKLEPKIIVAPVVKQTKGPAAPKKKSFEEQLLDQAL